MSKTCVLCDSASAGARHAAGLRLYPKLLRVIGLLIAALSFLQAQHSHPDAGPTAPVQLVEGLGTHTHPIATSSKLA